MRLLDRYLLRELFIPLGYCLCGFLIFYVAFDLIASLNRFQEHALNLRDVGELYLVKIPDILVFILPIALLLALLYTLTNHARHHEITAIRAAGVSLWRLCLPYLAVGFLLSVIAFALNELWVPDSEAKQDQIMERHNNVTADQTVQANLGFANTRDGRIWLIGSYNFKTDVMTSPQVDWKEGGANWHLLARRAERVNGVWTFYGSANPLTNPVTTSTNTATNAVKVPANGVKILRGDAVKGRQMDPYLETNVLSMPQFSETPSEFANEAKFNNRFRKLTANSAEVPIVELNDYLRVHPDLPQKYQWWLKTQLHGRFAAPWSCLVVVLIAIPFGAASGRRNVFVGVAGSIVICFVYFILLRVGLALGTGGFLPAWFAAWLPNAVFGITGFILMLRVR